MSTRITIDEAKLLAYHERMLDELYLLYHQHPTKIIDFHMTKEERAELAEGLGYSIVYGGG